MTSDAWLPPTPGGVRSDVEGSADIDSTVAEEYAENVGVDPSQEEVAEYVEMHRQIDQSD